MENSSKALLIAGAIIVAIALVSVSALVYEKVKGTVNNIDMDTTAVSTHNSRFVGYIGEVTGSQVKVCISNALANNYNENTTTEYKIQVKVGDDYYISFAADASKSGSGRQDICDNMSTNIKSNDIYTGTVTYGAHGIINEIVFTK